MEISKPIRNSVKRVLTFISPKLGTSLNYKYSTGQWLDWNNPQDINAKINILKVTEYYNNPVVTKCIDKYLIREYLKEKGLEELCPKLYGVYEKADEIDWNGLPNQFAVKCNHACGTNIIVDDKSKLDFEAAKKQLDKWMKMDYWREGEIQYKYIKKKIIIEEYLGAGEELKTYKFFCFNGEPKVLYISLDEDRFIDYYDMDFNKLPYSLPEHEHYPKTISKPENFDKMIEISKKLSNDFPFVRVDLYDSNGKIYISELTFVPTGGFMKIDPPNTLVEWGNWLKLKK
ncbi:MAG: ATP-grasp fold amidoligase family protein [Eubacterium sp.]